MSRPSALLSALKPSRPSNAAARGAGDAGSLMSIIWTAPSPAADTAQYVVWHRTWPAPRRASKPPSPSNTAETGSGPERVCNVHNLDGVII